jgi:hypothetical protein
LPGWISWVRICGPAPAASNTSIGAGIGATTSFLTNFVFENPPPLYAQPEQLSKVQVNRRDRPDQSRVAAED